MNAGPARPIGRRQRGISLLVVMIVVLLSSLLALWALSWNEAALSEGTENPSERRDQFMQLSTLQRLVGTVANNINQIARHANATGEVPAEAAANPG